MTSFQSDTVEDLEDEGDMMGAAVAVARNKLITHVSNTIINIGWVAGYITLYSVIITM